MTKKEKLQEEAKSLDGYSEKLTIAELEKLISNQSDGDDKPIEQDEVDEIEVRPEDDDNKVKFLNYEKTEVTKKVEAAEIKTVQNLSFGSVLGFGEEKETIKMDDNFYRRFNPRAGGYLTVEKDGKYGYLSKEEFSDYNEVHDI